MGGWKLPCSDFHNPFTARKYGLQQCLILYTEYLYSSWLVNRIPELRGKVLGCWCRPGLCHGDVIIIILNLCDTKGTLPPLERVKSAVYDLFRSC